MLHLSRFLSLAASLLLASVACAPAKIARDGGRPVVTTRLFAFHSNLWINLHHFLDVTGRARAGLDASRPAVTAALGDTTGFGALPSDLRDGWNDALAYYARAVASKDILFDSSLVAVNNRLAELEDAATVRGAARLDPDIASALDRASGAYRALWWPRHDALNHRWIDNIAALLAKNSAGAVAAREEVRLFRREWSPAPVRVDVAPYTNWAGAYTTEHPAHINVTSTPQPGYQGTEAFEALFHEVLHTMDDSLLTLLQTSFRANGKRWPRDPTHAFIFYTAGEITRRLFPGYVPFAEQAGMWTRVTDFARIRPLLRAHWQAYIDGKIPLEEALRRIAGGW